MSEDDRTDDDRTSDDDLERYCDLLLGVVSHDLRSPLDTIVFATKQSLWRGGLTKEQTVDLHRTLRSALRMTRMIDQLVDFTRARLGGGIPIEREDTDCEALCARYVDEWHAAHPERTIDLAVRRRPALANIDPDRVGQVVSNLIGNAIQHGSPDEPVRVVVDGNDEAVVLRVHNHGTPVSKNVILALFDAYRRAGENPSTSRPGAGLGLGLHLCRQIVSAHGGSIDVTSDWTDGTSFTVRLPR